MYEIKEIPNYPGYFVSTEGEVFSKRKRKRKIGARGGCTSYIGGELRLLKSRLRRGYPAVQIYANKKPKSFNINVLVLLTFVGARPKGMQSCHNDGNKFNNALSNLRWDTSLNNHADRKKHGTNRVPVGDNSASSKLNHFQVMRIKLMEEVDPNFNYTKIAKLFDLSRSGVTRIIKGETWKHITI